MKTFAEKFAVFGGGLIMFDIVGRWIFGPSDLEVIGAAVCSLVVTIWCHKARK